MGSTVDQYQDRPAGLLLWFVLVCRVMPRSLMFQDKLQLYKVKSSKFLRLSLARFFREGKYAILRENLAKKSLRNCDVRQVLCILTIFCRFKPKNVCILPKFSSFQSFQSKIILVKCCKEVIVPPE